MAEREVISLLVKLNTNFAKALGDMAKVEATIERIMVAVKKLEAKRVTIKLNTAELFKSATDVEKKMKRLGKLIEKALTGGELSAREQKEVAKLQKEVIKWDKYRLQVIAKQDEEASNLKSTVDQLTKSHKILAKEQQVQNKVASLPGKKKKKEISRAQHFLDLNKDINDLMGDRSDYVKDAIAMAKMEPKAMKDRFSSGEMRTAIKTLERYNETLGGVEKRLDANRKLASKTADVVAATTKQQLKDAEAADELLDTGEKLSKLRGDIEGFVEGTKKARAMNVKEAKKETTELEQQRVYQSSLVDSLRSVSDWVRFFRVRKFPFFRVFDLKEMDESKAYFKLLNDITDRIGENQELSHEAGEAFAKWTTNLRHALGVTKTYTGQFNRRMRYLTRDLYIFGIYFNQLAQNAVLNFRNMTKASSDLEGAFEDLTWARREAIEPIAEAIAPIIEGFAEVIEGVADFTEDLPGPLKNIIAWFLMLGVGVVSVVAKIIRLAAVMGIFVRSSQIMLGQQKKLVAAQTDYERHVVDIGVQMQTAAMRQDELTKSGRAGADVLKEFNAYMRILIEELIRGSQQMQNLGGDTSKMYEHLFAGTRLAKRISDEGIFGVLGDPKTWADSEDSMREFNEQVFFQTSALDEMYKSMEGMGKLGTFKAAMVDFAKMIIPWSTMKGPDVMLETEERFKELIEAQKKQQRATSRGSSTLLKLAGVFGTVTVTGAIMNSVMQETEGITSSLGELFTALLTPLQPLFEWLENIADSFTDLVEGMDPGAAVLTGLVGLLSVGVLGKLILTAIGGIATWISTKIGALLFGPKVVNAATGAITRAGGLIPKLWTAFKGGLKWIGTMVWGAAKAVFGFALANPIVLVIAAIIATLAGLYTAWKNDWNGMRDKVKKTFEGIKKWTDNIIRKLQELGDMWDRITGKTGTVSGASVNRFGPSSITELDTGGIIKRSGLAYLHAGETVVPRDLSRSSVTNHIYVTVAVDKTTGQSINEYSIGRIVSDEIANQLKRMM